MTVLRREIPPVAALLVSGAVLLSFGVQPSAATTSPGAHRSSVQDEGIVVPQYLCMAAVVRCRAAADALESMLLLESLRIPAPRLLERELAAVHGLVAQAGRDLAVLRRTLAAVDPALVQETHAAEAELAAALALIAEARSAVAAEPAIGPRIAVAVLAASERIDAARALCVGVADGLWMPDAAVDRRPADGGRSE